MRWGVLAMLIVFSLSGTPLARAQHAEGTAALPLPPEYTGCNLCHGAHEEDLPTPSLRLDEIPGLVTRLNVGAAGPGGASRSCLRCHATPALRAEQAAFRAGGVVGAEDAKFLGLDLTDDHPVGRVETLSLPELDPLRSPSLYREREGPPSLLGDDAATVDCTTCHDPHSRTSSVPGPEEQPILCGGCHEPMRYVRQGHTSVACTGCHRLHTGSRPALVASAFTDELCTSCHGPAGRRLGNRPAGDLPPPNAGRGHVEPPDGACSDCHAAHPGF